MRPARLPAALLAAAALLAPLAFAGCAEPEDGEVEVDYEEVNRINADREADYKNRYQGQ